MHKLHKPYCSFTSVLFCYAIDSAIYSASYSHLLLDSRILLYAKNTTRTCTDMSSGSEFDDDDDDLLLALINGKANITDNQVVPTQKSIARVPDARLDELQARVYQADGEVAVLRAQLQQIQKEKQDEIQNLKKSLDLYKKNSEEKESSLKYAVQKLEDEKKFLNNELKTTSAYFKKRKLSQKNRSSDNTRSAESTARSAQSINININSSVSDQDVEMEEIDPIQTVAPPVFVKQTNDSVLLVNHLWSYCIIGSSRTSLSYLSKICVDFDIQLSNFKVPRATSLSSLVVELLMLNKNLRLDELISIICLTLIELILELIENKSILSVPFLLSLIYCSISFRPLAISRDMIIQLLKYFKEITSRLVFVLDDNNSEDNGGDEDLFYQQNGQEEDFLSYQHDKTNQVMILEKFIFVCSYDIIEKLVTLSSVHEPNFIRSIWNDDIVSVEMFHKCLPENSERIRNSTQINLIYNYIEMLLSSITEETFGMNDSNELLNSLLKFFLIEISIKDNFMFYGFNRIIGNNKDFNKIDSLVPLEKNAVNNYLISIPQPIPYSELQKPTLNENFEIQSNHEYHLLNLRIKIGNLIESYIITNQSIEFLKQKETFKSLIRIVGFEQNSIIKFPRSKFVHLRIQIISVVIRILYYLTQDIQNSDLNNLIYPETMYELFVVILRIAFGSDSLSSDATKMLIKIRELGYTKQPIFNSWGEQKARELNHLNSTFTGKMIAEIERDFANGLEFPYEDNTVELSREILNLFVNHDEADNLYFNMNQTSEEA